ncbi:hypothetical protein COU91_03080 [Candidatus Saccharibacteria bacterium CG10_big_fil_rev_8_21_14_0_10_47_8]|nr:MAG: hypothetical protein COU91_03080 [Candidatus Saccharibacteria bacterium CG10_big_fil_rev_8_21_14_0_10_47_8]
MSWPKLWLLKLKISLRSALKVFRRPAYIVLALLTTLVASGSILWSLNLDLLRYIIFEAPISALAKVDFFFDIYKGVYTDFSSAQSTLVVIFSVLFGINLALLVFVLKHRGFKAIPKKSGAGGFALAIIGGGCIACGTSLIAPLLATFGASATPLIRDLATVFTFIGSLLIIYSIYKLGAVCSYIFTSQDLT